MKKNSKSMIAFLLTIVMALSSFAASVPANAASLDIEESEASLDIEESGACLEIQESGAVAFPKGSTTCYALSDSKVSVYNAKGQYIGYIDGKNDQCRITNFNAGSGKVYVSYPTSKGTKSGYAYLSNFVYNTSYNRAKAKLTRNATVYTKPNMSKAIGTAYKNDTVWIVSKKGNLTQIIYPISGGYKMGWVGQGSKENLSKALYNNSSAYISCNFDGYKSTSGRHEGIDIKLRTGAPIYSLTDGVIVRVAYGYNGSKGLSTIAIYNSATNKTVIYLHSAPISGLKAGQTIKKGQKIGTEGWRGISSSTASHTHVEVRNGKQSYAAKSVGDYKLDNTNPTSFWNSMGYNVK